jgi:hypothetical protein
VDGKNATKKAISAMLGHVRDRDRRERPAAGVAEREADRQRDRDRDRHRGARHLEVRPQQRQQLGAAHARAAGLRLARVQDVVEGVAELA